MRLRRCGAVPDLQARSRRPGDIFQLLHARISSVTLLVLLAREVCAFDKLPNLYSELPSSRRLVVCSANGMSGFGFRSLAVMVALEMKPSGYDRPELLLPHIKTTHGDFQDGSFVFIFLSLFLSAYCTFLHFAAVMVLTA